jgi:hypothetical protein
VSSHLLVVLKNLFQNIIEIDFLGFQQIHLSRAVQAEALAMSPRSIAQRNRADA